MPSATAVFKAVADFDALNREIDKTSAKMAALKAQSDDPASSKSFEASMLRMADAQKKLRGETDKLNVSKSKSEEIDKRSTSSSGNTAKARADASSASKDAQKDLSSTERAMRSLRAAHSDLQKAENASVTSAGKHAASLKSEQKTAGSKAVVLAKLKTHLASVTSAENAAVVSATKHTDSLGKETTALGAATAAHRAHASAVRATSRASSSATASVSGVPRSVRAASPSASSSSSSSGSGLSGPASQSGGLVSALATSLKDFSGSSGEAAGAGSALKAVLIGLVAPALPSLVTALVGSLVALGGSLVGVVGAAGPAAGAVAAFGPAALAAGGAAGTFMLSLFGIGAALNALVAVQMGAAQAARAFGIAMKSALRGLVNAQDAVTASKRAQASTAITTAHAIVEADLAEKRSHLEVKYALTALEVTRRQAVRDLVDLKNATVDATLAEEGSNISLIEAQKRLADVNSDVSSTGIQKREAALAVASAEQKLKESHLSTTRAVEDSNRAQALGVDGAQSVVAATQRVADAKKSETDAVYSAQETRRVANEETISANMAVIHSERALQAAMDEVHNTLTNQTSAQIALAQAMAKLSPAGQQFVYFLNSLLPLLYKLSGVAQTAFLPGLETAIKILIPMVYSVAIPAIQAFGAVLSKFVIDGAMLLTSFTADFVSFGTGAGPAMVGQFGQVLLNFASALLNVTFAAVPLAQWLSTLLLQFSEYVKTTTEASRKSGELATFFEKVRATLSLLGNILYNVGGILFSVFSAAAPLGNRLLQTFEQLTEKTNKYLKTAAGAAALKKYFDDMEPSIRIIYNLLDLIVMAFLRMGASKTTEILLRAVQDVLVPAFQRLAQAMSKLSLAAGQNLIDLLSKLADVLTNLLNAGGGGGFAAFFTILTDFVSVLQALSAVPFLAHIGLWLLAIAGGLKAIKVIGAITGLTKVAGALNTVGGRAASYAAGEAAPGKKAPDTFFKGAAGAVSGSTETPKTLTARAGAAVGGVVRQIQGKPAVAPAPFIAGPPPPVTPGPSAPGGPTPPAPPRPPTRGGPGPAAPAPSPAAPGPSGSPRPGPAPRVAPSTVPYPSGTPRVAGPAAGPVISGTPAAQAPTYAPGTSRTATPAAPSRAVSAARSIGRGARAVGGVASGLAASIGGGVAGSAIGGKLGGDTGSAIGGLAGSVAGSFAPDVLVTGLKKITPALTGVKAGLGGLASSLSGAVAGAARGAVGGLGRVVASAGGAAMSLGRVAAGFVAAGIQAALAAGKQLLFAAAGVVVRGAVLAWTAAQWLLNAAMSANPIGIVIAVLALLVGAFILAWTHSETFRNVVMGVLDAIGGFFKMVWEKFISPVFEKLLEGFRQIGTGCTWLWQNAIKPAWDGIGSLIGVVWNNVLKPIFAEYALGVKQLGDAATWLWNNAIKPAWDGIGSLISGAYTGVIKPAWDAMMAGLKFIENGFTVTVNAIGTTWNNLKGEMARPINFMIDTVWNGGIVKAWNLVAGILPGMKPLAPLARIPELATGGQVPGVGDRDTVPALLTPGEYVISKPVVEKWGLKNIHTAHMSARAGGLEGLFSGPGDHQGLQKVGRYAAGGPVQLGIDFAKAQSGKPYIWGGVGPAGYDCCVIPDTRVYGPGGVRPIRDVCVGDQVYSYVNNKLEAHSVLNVWQSSHQQVYSVRTRNRTVTASANHPFMRIVPVSSKTTYYDDVSWPGLPSQSMGYRSRMTAVCCVGDCKAVVHSAWMCSNHHNRWRTHGDPRITFTTGKEYDVEWARLDQLNRNDLLVQPKKMELNSKPFSELPDGTVVDRDVAWLIGLMIGDGGVHDKGVRICVYGDIRDRASSIITEKWGSHPTFGDSYGLTVSCVRLRDALTDMGMRCLGPVKRVPDSVWLWSEELQRSFLSGYCEADGHTPKVDTKKHGECIYHSASRDLVSDVRALHICFGDAVSNLSTNWRERSIIINGKLVKKALPLHSFTVWGCSGRGESTFRRVPGLTRWLDNGEFTLAKVLDIKDAGFQDTWDIEVDGAHNFVADGVVVHNSGFMSAITNVLLGRNPYQRLGTTYTAPWSGFNTGLTSQFGIGVSQEHMAGTLDGTNVEAGGSPSLVRYGGIAAGATHKQFTKTHMSLPQAGGIFTGGPGGGSGAAAGPDVGWIKAKIAGWVTDIINPLINKLPVPPPALSGIPRDLSISVRDTAQKWFLGQAETATGTSAAGGVSGGDHGTGPAIDQVRGVATRYGWGAGPEWDALYKLVMKESSWNVNAANSSSSARGLFQKMTNIHGAVEATAAGQAEWGLKYIKGRYGDPLAAWAHETANNWYAKGGPVADSTGNVPGKHKSTGNKLLDNIPMKMLADGGWVEQFRRSNNRHRGTAFPLRLGQSGPEIGQFKRWLGLNSTSGREDFFGSDLYEILREIQGIFGVSPTGWVSEWAYDAFRRAYHVPPPSPDTSASPDASADATGFAAMRTAFDNGTMSQSVLSNGAPPKSLNALLNTLRTTASIPGDSRSHPTDAHRLSNVGPVVEKIPAISSAYGGQSAVQKQVAATQANPAAAQVGGTGADLQAYLTAVSGTDANTKEFESDLLILEGWGLQDLALSLSKKGVGTSTAPGDAKTGTASADAGGLVLARQAVANRVMATAADAALKDQRLNTLGDHLEVVLRVIGKLAAKEDLGIRDVSLSTKYEQAGEISPKDIFMAMRYPRAKDELAKLPPNNTGRFNQNMQAYAMGVPFATGGRVGGTGIGDVVPAMLTPGEFVIRKQAASALGPQRLKALNAAHTSPWAAAMAEGGPVAHAADLFAPMHIPNAPRVSLGTSVSSALKAATAATVHTGDTNTKSTVFEKGAVQIHNPAPQRAVDSFENTMRKLTWTGVMK